MDTDPGGNSNWGSASLVRSAVSGVLLVAVGALLVLIYQALPFRPGGQAAPKPSSPTAAPAGEVVPTATLLLAKEATIPPAAYPSPTAVPSATLTPTQVPATPTPLPPIVVEEPKAGQIVQSPIRVSGDASVYEGTVSYQVVDLQGHVLGRGFTTASEGAPGRGHFEGDLEFAQPATQQEAQVQVFEVSAKDGSVRNLVAIPVTLEAAPPTSTPVPSPEVSSEGSPVRAQVTDVAASARVITGADAQGKAVEIALDTSTRLVSASGEPIDLLGIMPGSLIEASGRPIASRPGAMVATRVVLVADEAIRVLLYYPRSTETDIEFVSVPRLIAKVPGIGRATIGELLRGPTVEEQGQGLANPIPKAARLLSLKIENGVAYADFDRGLEEGVGGSVRVMSIRRMIEFTLKQFSTVQEVVLSIEGRTEDILQP